MTLKLLLLMMEGVVVLALAKLNCLLLDLWVLKGPRRHSKAQSFPSIMELLICIVSFILTAVIFTALYLDTMVDPIN